MRVYNEPNKLTRALWQCHNWLAKLKFKRSRRLWACAISRLANMSVTLSCLEYPKKHNVNSFRVLGVNVVHNAEPKRHMQYVWNTPVLTKQEHCLNWLANILQLVNKDFISLLISSSHRSLRITFLRFLNFITKVSVCPLAKNWNGKISHIARLFTGLKIIQTVLLTLSIILIANASWCN